jgi:hypothetical protein
MRRLKCTLKRSGCLSARSQSRSHQVTEHTPPGPAVVRAGWSRVTTRPPLGPRSALDVRPQVTLSFWTARQIVKWGTSSLRVACCGGR